MLRYIIKRILQAVSLLFVISFIVFLLIYIINFAAGKLVKYLLLYNYNLKNLFKYNHE